MLALLPDEYVSVLRRIGFTKYHLGCNALLLDGWLNIDLFPQGQQGLFYQNPFQNNPNAYLVNFDLRKGIPADDGTLEYIYHSHFLEHLNFADGLALLKETYRSLKVGGKQRIIVPDLEKFARSYLDPSQSLINEYRENESWFAENPHYKTRGSVFMAMLYEFGHKMGWDYETSHCALSDICFRHIRRVAYQESSFPDILHIEDYSEPRVAESLFVECEK